MIHSERFFLETARPFLIALSHAARAYEHTVAIADKHAWLLELVETGESTVGSARWAGLQASEQRIGANGIGSALAEVRYVEIVGAEHYARDFQGFTCQALPLLGPDGLARGALALSVKRLGAMSSARDILLCAHHAVQDSLCTQLLAERVHGMADGHHKNIVELLRQDLVQLQAASRLRFEGAARRIAAGGDAAAVIDTATQMARKFRRRAEVFQDLVDDTDSVPTDVDLGDSVGRLSELLETEVRINGIALDFGRLDRIRVRAPPKELMRRLLNRFVWALEWAGQGGRVQLEVLDEAARGTATVRFSAFNGRTRSGRSATVEASCRG